MFGSRARRALVAGVAVSLVAASGFFVSQAGAAGTTNGDPITFDPVNCTTSVGLNQMMPITVQAVVPNQVNQGDSYQVTIPGGTAPLPNNSGPPTNLTITGYKNLNQTYLFSPSSGSVNITAAVAGSATATNNGNPVAFNVTNTATTVTLSTPVASPGTLTTPDVTVTITAPTADATVTTYTTVVTTTATITPLGDVAVTCATPHANPQTDGISATLVGAGGPTTSSEAQCRKLGATGCTTTSTAGPTTTGGPTTTTTMPSGPTLTISDSSAVRPSGGTAKMTFVVTLSTPATATVKAHWATADNSAHQPADYKAKSGTVSIGRGHTTGTFYILITGGVIGQPAKTLFINLSAPVGATISRSQAIGTIVDNHLPGITVQDASAPVPPTRNSTMIFNVVLSRPAATKQTCTIPYVTSDVTAVAGIDYKAKHGTIRIGAGKATGVIKITILPTATPDDIFIVQVGVPTNCITQDGVGVGTLTG